MAELVAARRAETPAAEADPDRAPARPRPAAAPEFTVARRRASGWRVRGDEARALGPADRLQQRRGRRLPRRPAQPARRRGQAARARRRGGRHGADRRRRQRRGLRLPPEVEAGAEMLGRRGEDQRFEEPARGAASPRDRRGDGRPRRGRDPRRRGPPARRDRRRHRAAPTPTAAGPRTTGRVTPATGGIARPPHRVVVKVGSSSLTTAAGGIDPARVARAGRRARRRARARRRGGAGLLRARSPPGWRRWRCARRPRDLATQQAAASVGQGLLVHRYTEEFARHGIVVGQVLLTVDDVTRRSHYRNAYRTFARLLELGVRADRQRERHRGHHRDPVRRQRPARRAGRAPGARRPAAAAQRRRRALRRRPRADPARTLLAEVRCDGRPGRRATSAGRARPGSAPAACRPRSRRPGSPPAPGSRWC